MGLCITLVTMEGGAALKIGLVPSSNDTRGNEHLTCSLHPSQSRNTDNMGKDVISFIQKENRKPEIMKQACNYQGSLCQATSDLSEYLCHRSLQPDDILPFLLETPRENLKNTMYINLVSQLSFNHCSVTVYKFWVYNMILFYIMYF